MLAHITPADFSLQSLNFARLGLPPARGAVLLIKAAWCGHCKTYMPTFEQYSKQFPNYHFLILDADEAQSLLAQWSQLVYPVFTARGFPTVVLYDLNGVPLKAIADRFGLVDYLS